jgi:hypothetical protein
MRLCSLGHFALISIIKAKENALFKNDVYVSATCFKMYF